MRTILALVSFITMALFVATPGYAQKGPTAPSQPVSGSLALFIWTLPGTFDVEQNVGTAQAFGLGQMSFDETTGVATMSYQIDGQTTRGTGTLEGDSFIVNWGGKSQIHYTLGDARFGDDQTLFGRPPGGGDVSERWRPQL